MTQPTDPTSPTGGSATPAGSRAGRRRRRAVGPRGATPDAGVDRMALQLEPVARDEPAPVDDDERLRRDVPPHHGG